uniref:DUF19 domain-containing protein n=1 Tax=Rhabditophanes sp. KR3021 TaxID=114890 RepID=A0AC35UFB2_9BILA
MVGKVILILGFLVGVSVGEECIGFSAELIRGCFGGYLKFYNQSLIEGGKLPPHKFITDTRLHFEYYNKKNSVKALCKNELELAICLASTVACITSEKIQKVFSTDADNAWLYFMDYHANSYQCSFALDYVTEHYDCIKSIPSTSEYKRCHSDFEENSKSLNECFSVKEFLACRTRVEINHCGELAGDLYCNMYEHAYNQKYSSCDTKMLICSQPNFREVGCESSSYDKVTKCYDQYLTNYYQSVETNATLPSYTKLVRAKGAFKKLHLTTAVDKMCKIHSNLISCLGDEVACITDSTIQSIFKVNENDSKNYVTLFVSEEFQCRTDPVFFKNNYLCLEKANNVLNLRSDKCVDTRRNDIIKVGLCKAHVNYIACVQDLNTDLCGADAGYFMCNMLKSIYTSIFSHCQDKFSICEKKSTKHFVGLEEEWI